MHSVASFAFLQRFDDQCGVTGELLLAKGWLALG
jgi:hypothetical protein